jgi:hypothetical protein
MTRSIDENEVAHVKVGVNRMLKKPAVPAVDRMRRQRPISFEM